MTVESLLVVGSQGRLPLTRSYMHPVHTQKSPYIKKSPHSDDIFAHSKIFVYALSVINMACRPTGVKPSPIVRLSGFYFQTVNNTGCGSFAAKYFKKVGN